MSIQIDSLTQNLEILKNIVINETIFFPLLQPLFDF